ncbi:hypothetical protein COO64_09180 [Pseudomonas donghuensis]|nr:hypothetical protein COO64_09180 [Pseudomonas donghuensis]
MCYVDVAVALIEHQAGSLTLEFWDTGVQQRGIAWSSERVKESLLRTLWPNLGIRGQAHFFQRRIILLPENTDDAFT